MKIIDLKNDPERLTELAHWHQQEWSHLNPGETIEQRIRRMQAYLNDNFIPGMVIAKEKILLGSAAIVTHDMETRPQLTPWLASVFVTPEYRNKGIASKLIAHVMTQAKNHGIKKLYLYTQDRESYYQKRHWQSHSHATYHGQAVTIMQCDLLSD